MSLRKEFVMRVLGREAPVTKLCREYGISRKTAYKWLERFRERGTAGLVDETRRPTNQPTRTRVDLVARIVAAREEHPTWGAKKLRRLLMRSFGARTPSEKTIGRVLHDRGLTRKRRFRPTTAPVPKDAPRVSVATPNDLWTVDFKGWWRTRDRARCEPLTVRDAFSRYVLCLRAVPGTADGHVRPVFEELFRRYGVPTAIQVDNGPPWVSRMSLGGLTKLSAWWTAIGIALVRGRPGKPQDNGAHERLHVDIEAELERRPAESVAAQQARFDEWVAEFNHVRPHEALDMRTPADLYRRGHRRLPTLVVPSYPPDWHTHRVDKTGKVEVRGKKTYFSTVLAGHVVGLEERSGRFRVWFCHLLLGSFVPGRDDRVLPPAVDEAVAADGASSTDARRVGHEVRSDEPRIC